MAHQQGDKTRAKGKTARPSDGKGERACEAGGAAARPLRVSQVAEQAGVSKQTVEYYILLGLIAPERHPDTNRRLFTDEDVRRVKLIKRMNQTGYTLRDIREIWLKDK